MKTLFPEYENELRQDRRAAKREKAQHARQYLRGRDISWLINQLLEHGPKQECWLLVEAAMKHQEDAGKQMSEILLDLDALWKIGKLWRKSLGIHEGSGVETFLFGIKGVHEKP